MEFIERHDSLHFEGTLDLKKNCTSETKQGKMTFCSRLNRRIKKKSGRNAITSSSFFFFFGLFLGTKLYTPLQVQAGGVEVLVKASNLTEGDYVH